MVVVVVVIVVVVVAVLQIKPEPIECSPRSYNYWHRKPLAVENACPVLQLSGVLTYLIVDLNVSMDGALSPQQKRVVPESKLTTA